MGRIKDLYIDWLNETFKDDVVFKEYLKRMAESDQEQWEAWRKEQENKKEQIMIRDFIQNYVDPLDIPEFWTKMLDHDVTAIISHYYRKTVLFKIIAEIKADKEKKQ